MWLYMNSPLIKEGCLSILALKWTASRERKFFRFYILIIVSIAHIKLIFYVRAQQIHQRWPSRKQKAWRSPAFQFPGEILRTGKCFFLSCCCESPQKRSKLCNTFVKIKRCFSLVWINLKARYNPSNWILSGLCSLSHWYCCC